MEKRNDFTLKAMAGAILALLLAVGVFLAVDAAFPVRQWGPPNPPGQDLMQNVFLLQMGLSTAMILLSLYLLFTYLKDYLQLKSGFTLGIIFAVFSLMLFAISANPALHIFLGVYGGRGLFTLVPYLFATISLAVLVWVSSK
jgi:hypothetical protein